MAVEQRYRTKSPHGLIHNGIGILTPEAPHRLCSQGATHNIGVPSPEEADSSVCYRSVKALGRQVLRIHISLRRLTDCAGCGSLRSAPPGSRRTAQPGPCRACGNRIDWVHPHDHRPSASTRQSST
ncbi:hypothetical protein GCM10010353_70590 [Streptomyces chryseus]|nr:hypothetical protein GCM10010353_70590 [Streptomyces chryseus]